MKVLVIDDHPLIQHGIASLVRQLGDDVRVTAVGAAQPARDALAAGDDFDLALLDLDLGGDDGFALLEELRDAHPALPIVIVAASDHRDDVMRAIDKGALGFIPKCAGNDTLLSALRMVLAGGIYVPPALMRSPTPAERPAPRNASMHWDERADSERCAATIASLDMTPRQKQVLALLLRGQSNKLIARALNLSVETIKDHVAAVLRALNVATRTQAVVAVSNMARSRPVAAWRQPHQDALRH